MHGEIKHLQPLGSIIFHLGVITINHISILLFLFLSSVTITHAALPFEVTREELRIMPPYCSAIYGRFIGEPPPDIHPLRNTIPNCYSVHHYCDALKFVVRTNGAWNNKNDEKYYWQNAEKSFASVIEEWKTKSPDCSLYPEAYTNLANNILRGSKYGPNRIGEALTNFEAAILKNKNYVPAYIGLADAYLKYKEKNKAIQALERGLQENRESTQLAKKYKTLGGNPELFITALPTPITKRATSAPVQLESNTASENTTADNLPSQKTETTKQSKETPSPPKVGSPSNPWCRFCPDADAAEDKQ